MKRLSLIIITIFLFTGCIIKNDENSFKLSYMHSTQVTDFNSLTNDLLKDLCPILLQIKQYKKIISPLYVTDFVNISNLTNNSDLGFLLSDELKTNISQNCNWPIYAIEYTKYLKLGTNGTKILSRDIADIKQIKMNKNTYALVGTYSVTQRQLILYLKLINLKNGVILKSSTQKTTLTDEILNFEKKQKEEKQQPQIYQPMVI